MVWWESYAVTYAVSRSQHGSIPIGEFGPTYLPEVSITILTKPTEGISFGKMCFYPFSTDPQAGRANATVDWSFSGCKKLWFFHKFFTCLCLKRLHFLIQNIFRNTCHLAVFVIQKKVSKRVDILVQFETQCNGVLPIRGGQWVFEWSSAGVTCFWSSM